MTRPRCFLKQPARAAFALVLALAPLLAGASGDSPQSDSRKRAYKPTGQEGTLTGTVFFEGALPEKRYYAMSADSWCDRAARKRDLLVDDVVVNNGRLANVFVYVESAELDGLAFEAPQGEAVLERRKCRTVPRVLGVQTGQTLRLRNSDQTTHNYNVQAVKNEMANRSLPPDADDIVMKFEVAETFIPVKCNQHPWEKGYVGVFDHPFFAVSDAGGFFVLEGLPPGRYTVVAWHEKFKAQRQEVTVGRKDSENVDFTFEMTGKAESPFRPGDVP